MADSLKVLKECINQCLIGKLAKSFDQCNHHAEYQIRSKMLNKQFPTLLSLLGSIDSTNNQELIHEVVCLLLILYEELRSNGPWSTDYSRECSMKLNNIFKHVYGVPLDKVLTIELFNAQLLFDTCMNKLHEKINTETLKHYPTLVEVYCSVIKNLKEYKICITPTRTVTISLLLIDDYINENRIKGLSCCSSILKCLSKKHFLNGNYYEVIYACLRKVIVEKDLEVTKLVLICTFQLLQILPSDVKDNNIDQIYVAVLDQLYVESNLYRKALLFKFIMKVIQLHGVNCIKKKTFIPIVCENIDVCSNKDVSDILLIYVLECLEMWVKYCWCAWKLSSDKKVLMSLFKILYLNEQYELKIHNLIITLIRLCTEEEQKQIFQSLEETPIHNENFLQKINKIKLNCIM